MRTFANGRLLVATTAVAAIVGLMVGLAGCSSGSETGGGTGGEAGAPQAVAQGSLEQKIRGRYNRLDGPPADDVRCDGYLEAQVGATQHCAILVAGTWIPVTVTVDSVDGDAVDFTIKADDPGTSP